MEELNLIVGATLNTKNMENQLQGFLKRKEVTKEINVRLKDGDIEKRLMKVTTYVDKLGNAITGIQTSKSDGAFGDKSKIVSVTSAYKGLTQEVKQLSSSYSTYIDKAGNWHSTMTQLNADGTKIKTMVKEEIDALGKLTRTTEVQNEVTGETLSINKEEFNDKAKRTKQYKEIQQGIQKTTEYTQQEINGNKVLTTTMTEVNAQGDTMVTRITQTTDATGKVTKQIDYLAKDMKTKLKPSVTEVVDDTQRFNEAQRKLMENITLTTSTTNTWVNGNKALRTSVQSLDKDGNKITTTITKYTDTLGRCYTVTEKLDASGKPIQGTLTEIRDKAEKTTQSFSNIITKVTKFYLAQLPMRLFNATMQSVISTVKELDNALVELTKVSNFELNTQSLQDYMDKLTELGSTVGRTTTEMVEGATQFKKAGYSEEDSAILAQINAKYQNTADEVLSASEASSVLISQMKAFNITAENSIHIVDSINKVSANFAVSSADIGKGLTQAGASLQTYGNSFDQVVGLT